MGMNPNLIALVVAGLIATQAAAADVERPVPDEFAQSLARVRVVNETRRLANGSGVAVRRDMLITSCHGTRHARWIDVLHQGRDWKVKRLVEDVEHDLCLLQVEGEAFVPFALAEADRQLRLGDYVVAIGFAGPKAQMAEGAIKAMHWHDGAYVIQTDAAFKSGESGGALLDRDQKLVGILTFFADEKRSGFFAVPVQWVRQLIDRADGDGQVGSQPGSAFWERTESELPMFMRALAREYAEDWDSLRRLALQWIQLDADNPEAWFALGKALDHSDERAAALGALKETIKLAPRHADGWFYLGRIHAALRQVDEWAAAVRQLEVLSPAAAAALRGLLHADTDY
jgi:tetratricopeptide (TPR) repeat protein